MEGGILPFFMHVNTICILGGGTSGFTAASILARYREVSGLNFGIKLIYSKDIGTIGVGESTLLSINDLFNYLNIKDSEWMKECNATYKTSIRFEDFNKGNYFHYPFGDIDSSRSNTSGIRQWFISKEADPVVFSPERASLYFLPHTILAERNKLTRDGIDGFDLEPAYQKVGKTYTHYEFVTALKEKLKLDNINFIKGYFNDVVKTWDKDIDILHIDGSHDYDSVKEDYENWSPFVKDTGFILFHDTVSHPTSIGKFFNEIGDGYSKINFTHSCGLGVASKNKELMDVITIE